MANNMKAASIAEIKQALENCSAAKLSKLCLTLARYKKDNKEMLTYLLFEADDTAAYINNVKLAMDEQFTEINSSNLYFAKKTLRKILRITGKHIRYTASKEAEAELLIYFCHKLKSSGIPFDKSQVLVNLYQSQLKKIKTAVAGMHEDLQYDYLRELEGL